MATIKDPLISMLDSAVTTLLQRLSPPIRSPDEAHQVPDGTPEPEPITFSERIKAIELGAKWVGIKNKIDIGDDLDEFGKLRAGHVGGTRSGSRSRSASRSNGTA